MIAEKPTYRLGRNGTLSIPSELLEKAGISEGDYVTLTETKEGILVSSGWDAVNQAFDELGRILREEGVTLEDLIENGRIIREQIAREKYAKYLRE